jgi:hypothetical protein
VTGVLVTAGQRATRSGHDERRSGSAQAQCDTEIAIGRIAD